MSNIEEDDQYYHSDDETGTSTTSSSGISEALRDDGVSKHAIASTWGYELYDEIVEFPPDVLSSLRNNLVPSLLAIEYATAGREDAAYHIKRIDARLTEIEKQIKRLNREKDDLWTESKPHRTKLRGCDAVLSPIRRIPFDIIRSIARLTLLEHPSPCRRQSPINLSQVSSSWRSAVLSLPQLWARLCVTVDLSYTWTLTTQQIYTFFSRAQQPLTLCIYFKGTQDQALNHHESERLRVLLNNIAPIIPLISRLGIGAHDLSNMWDHLEFKELGWDFRNLEHLHLVDHENQDGPVNTVPSFTNTPRLSRLSVAGFNFNPIVFDLAWASLNNIRVTEELTFDAWRWLMNACPQLRIGDFTISSDSDISFTSTTTLNHSTLEDLTFRSFYDSYIIISILLHFQMPSLRRLSLSCEEVAEDPFPQTPSNFASLSNLRYLSIVNSCKERAEYVTNILRKATNLEELIFASCPRNFSVFEAMVVDSASSEHPPSPNLRILRIQTQPLPRVNTGSNRNVYFHIDPLVRMLASRRPSQIPSGCKALEEFFFCPRFAKQNSLALQKRMANELQEELALCLEEGMKIHCSNSEEDIGFRAPVDPFDTWMM